MEQKEYDKNINEKNQQILELKRENQALRMLNKRTFNFSYELTKVIHQMDLLLEKKKPGDSQITLGEERAEEDFKMIENEESYVKKCLSDLKINHN